MPAIEAPRRYPTIDLLRLVAIAMTMLVHTPSLSRTVFFVRPFAGGLWLGVDLFMLISGWLLGGQLLRESEAGSISPCRFYVKRWLRTLPPYYFMLVVLYYGGWSEFAGPLPTSVILSHLTFLQGYATGNHYLVSWSLCVEEHFYLLLPLLIAVLARWPRLRVAIGIVVGAGLLSLTLRALVYFGDPSTSDTPKLSALRCDGLFIGLLLAWVNLKRPALWTALGRWTGVSLGLGTVATLFLMTKTSVDFRSAWLYVFMPTLGTWTLAMVFIACVHVDSFASRVDFRGLSYLGGLTYAMYLTHNVLPRAWVGGFGAGSALAALWRMVLVVAVSVFIHHLVERPALALRKRVLSSGWFQPSAPPYEPAAQPNTFS